MAYETEALLVEAMKARERLAWDQAIGAHARDVYSLIFHLTSGDVGTSEDLGQETWVQAVDHFDRFDIARGSVRDWLLGIARKRVAMHFRRNTHRRTSSVDETYDELLDVGDGGILPEQALEQLERATVTRAALLMLSENHREVLNLKYVDGLTVNEIADQFGKSAKAVESLLTRARDQLRKLLCSYYSSSIQGESHERSIGKRDSA